jgi:dynamin 1-like protein
MNHIRDKLPDMKARLNTLMGQAQQELNSFGDSTTYSGDKNLQGALILRLMTQFARDFVSSIEGTSASSFTTKELSGGARVYYIFNDVYGNALNGIDATSSLTLSDSDIRTAIRNSTGPRPSLFVPEGAFELLVKPLIGMLEGPSLRCVEMVYEELVKICHNCTNMVSLTLLSSLTAIFCCLPFHDPCTFFFSLEHTHLLFSFGTASDHLPLPGTPTLPSPARPAD